MLDKHLMEIQHPPFTVGQLVRIKEDGPGGEVHHILGAVYEHRMVPNAGWNFHVATEDQIENGYGGTDGFGPEHLEFALST